MKFSRTDTTPSNMKWRGSFYFPMTSIASLRGSSNLTVASGFQRSSSTTPNISLECISKKCADCWHKILINVWLHIFTSLQGKIGGILYPELLLCWCSMRSIPVTIEIKTSKHLSTNHSWLMIRIHLDNIYYSPWQLWGYKFFLPTRNQLAIFEKLHRASNKFVCGITSNSFQWCLIWFPIGYRWQWYHQYYLASILVILQLYCS